MDDAFFTWEAYRALNVERRKAIDTCCELLSSNLPEDWVDEQEVDAFLSLLETCEGCVPREHEDGDLTLTIAKKFRSVYGAALSLCEPALRHMGFIPDVVVDPSYEGTTQVVIADKECKACFLYVWDKPWQFHFDNLSALADEILSARDAIMKNATRSRSEE